jgi:hypothetical protein
MDGNVIGDAVWAAIITCVGVAFVAGLGCAGAAVWVWPCLRVWIHWATGE